jgi:2,4-dienoyl-CoA reductase-like NADH-dependent reductase (Old Yellow Enzyme family)|tara:strand:- start:345 stop:1118 length:774 start_codon:yes stop_codon:yes gene_type:complete
MRDQTNYKLLFEPISIGTIRLKNRIAMAPMATGFFSNYGLVTEKAKAYYEARAKGGAGLVIVESSCIDFPRGHGPNRGNIDSDLTIKGLTSLTDAIHKHGAKAAIQIYHVGRLGNIKYSGLPSITPSSTQNPDTDIPKNLLPVELTVKGINEISRLYGESAVRAKKAGFDGIEIHAAHGYLISQFLSPVSNQRQDEYGGSLENRSRFLLDILKVIRDLVGDDFPVWYRINGHEYGMEGALCLEDVKKIISMGLFKKR